MNRNANVGSVKPVLEQLEGRDMPSFLLGGAVPQLAAPLATINQDLTNSAAALHTDVAAVFSAGTKQGAEIALGNATADWQRMVTDQHAIQATANANLAFINAAAMAEFQNGDSLDLIVLYFGPAFGIHATSPLTDQMGKADATINGHDVQTDISTNLGFASKLDTIHYILKEQVPTPSF
jgi:hypothetical protein